MKYIYKALLLSIGIHAAGISGYYYINQNSNDHRLQINLVHGVQNFVNQNTKVELVNISKEYLSDKLNKQDDSKKNKKQEKGVKSQFDDGLKNPEPIYPQAALRWNWEGVVSLKLEILENGSVGNVHVLKSSGYDLLDETAITTVKKWRFPEVDESFLRNIQIEFKIKK